MDIREALREEWPACADIYVRAGRAAFTWTDPELFQAANIITWAEQGETLYLAFDDGRPVGMMSFWRPDNFIHNLFVEIGCNGRGVGTALLRYAYGVADGPVTLKCDLANAPALRFYARRGMIEIQRGMRPESGPYVVFLQPPETAR